jgi:hypothetical protein
MTLLELAERCEQATGPDRELDLAIGLNALGWEWVENYFDSNPILDIGAPNHIGWRESNPLPDCVPSPTASLDAALVVVPDCHIWTLFQHEEYAVALVTNRTLPRRVIDADEWRCVAATPALALCAAALRAQGQQP